MSCLYMGEEVVLGEGRDSIGISFQSRAGRAGGCSKRIGDWSMLRGFPERMRTVPECVCCRLPIGLKVAWHGRW